jgi:hypothetical protein
MSRRSAKRSSRQAAERPGLDRDVLISLLELDPDFAAMLRGEAPPGADQFTPTRQVEPSAAEQPFTIEQVEIVVAPTFEQVPAAEPVQQEARIIDVSATVEKVRVEKAPAVERGSRGRHTRQPKPSRSRSSRTRQRPSAAPAAEQLAAMRELYDLAPPTEQVVREAPAAEQVAATTGLVVLAPPEFEQAAATGLAVHESAAAQAAAFAPSLERTIEKARAEIALRNLPIKIPNFSETMLQVQRAGWSIPPARRLQWDYMNFQMPPLSDEVLTPRQAKRKEWRTMLKYYRFHPYKSHYRQDQKETRRMISQAKRAKLNLA